MRHDDFKFMVVSDVELVIVISAMSRLAFVIVCLVCNNSTCIYVDKIFIMYFIVAYSFSTVSCGFTVFFSFSVESHCQEMENIICGLGCCRAAAARFRDPVGGARHPKSPYSTVPYCYGTLGAWPRPRDCGIARRPPQQPNPQIIFSIS